MLVESRYKEEINKICLENRLMIIFEEVVLDEIKYLHITYGGIFLKPILERKGIKYYEV